MLKVNMLNPDLKTEYNLSGLYFIIDGEIYIDGSTDAIRHNSHVNLFDTIIEKYKALEDKNDFMLVEGTDFSGEGTAIELDANILIAKNLGIPAIIVSSGVGKTLEEFINGLHLTYDSFTEKEVKVLAVIANKVQEENLKIVIDGVEENLPKDVVVNAIPLISSLNNMQS